MAKRLYNSVYGEPEPVVTPKVVVQEEAPVENTSQPNDAISQSFFSQKMILALFSILIGLLLIFIFVASRSYFHNIKSGGNTSQESVVGFITCLADDDDSSLFSYIPSDIRESGFLIDTAGLSDLQKVDEIYHITFTAITINESVPLTDIEGVGADIKFQYKLTLPVEEAVAARVSAKYEYLDGVDTKTDVFSADLVSIKLNGKWFICPGVSIPEGTFSVTSTENTLESVSVEEKPVQVESVDTLNYILPVEKEIVEIEPYKNALKDLQAGKVNIEGNDYVFPCPYLDMLDVVRLCYDNDVTSLDSLTAKTSIRPNYILNNLPAVFTNLNYNMADLFISIGNRTKENIYVDAGDVTMFYIGIPHSPYSYQIYDYPTVLLPGSVTLGTRYSDVEAVYGKLSKCEDTSNVIAYSDDAKCYAVQLDNSHNFIYLQFVDDKLVSIQWYYYDFNAYNS